MVEAAIFFPIAVLAAMAVLYMTINMYSDACTQSYMHREARRHAADVWGKTEVSFAEAHGQDRYRFAAENAPEGDIDKSGMTWSYVMRDERRYYGGRLTNPGGAAREYLASAYAISEEILVRAFSMGAKLVGQ